MTPTETPAPTAASVADRLRQSVQGCTLHSHGPVQAWAAARDAVASGSVRPAELRAALDALHGARTAELATLDPADPRVRKEVLTHAFLQILLPDDRPMTAFHDAIAPARAAVMNHPVYDAVRSPAAVQAFMSHHVFAVWDFMSLLKALQRGLTGVTHPWVPVGDPQIRRFVNEVVLDEESDDLGDGRVLSHLELYLDAMTEADADTTRVQHFLTLIAQRNVGVPEALDRAGVPAPAAAFVRSTMTLIEGGRLHEIAAAFAAGREDAIPEMFTRFLDALPADLRLRYKGLDLYLERHIELDGDKHGALADRLVASLCPTPRHWAEATAAATTALNARTALWYGIAAAARAAESDAEAAA